MSFLALDSTGQRHTATYLEIFVYDDLAILLEHPQYFSTLSQVPRLWVYFHMNTSAYCVSISWDGFAGKGNSRCCHFLKRLFVLDNDIDQGTTVTT